MTVLLTSLRKNLERKFKTIGKERSAKLATDMFIRAKRAANDWVAHVRKNMSKTSISRGYGKYHRLNPHEQWAQNRFNPMFTSGNLSSKVRAGATLIKVDDLSYNIRMVKAIGPAYNKGFDYAKWLNEEHTYLSGYKERAFSLLDTIMRRLADGKY